MSSALPVLGSVAVIGVSGLLIYTMIDKGFKFNEIVNKPHTDDRGPSDVSKLSPAQIRNITDPTFPSIATPKETLEDARDVQRKDDGGFNPFSWIGPSVDTIFGNDIGQDIENFATGAANTVLGWIETTASTAVGQGADAISNFLENVLGAAVPQQLVVWLVIGFLTFILGLFVVLYFS